MYDQFGEEGLKGGIPNVEDGKLKNNMLFV